MDLDVEGHQAQVRMRATWTNPHDRPTSQLVFNVHSHFVVPTSDVGLYAKTLELLRLNASEALGSSTPAFNLHGVSLASGSKQDSADCPLTYAWTGDTNTTLEVNLPKAVGKGESVTILLDFTMKLPPKQGRWGQYKGVTFLTNWLPVFAYYGGKRSALPPHILEEDACWQPTPFVAWHQPFFNEAGHYRARINLPADHHIGCTGVVRSSQPLEGCRQLVDIEAPAVRDFAFLCSKRYHIHETCAIIPQTGRKVKVRVLAFAEHAHYAREMLKIVCHAIEQYSKWFGPYPYEEFTIAESYFGWNGNECGGLVMIDERVFGMPHLAHGYVDYLVSHEVCHQWWYNVVGTNGYAETWMDEALATYFSHRLLNEKVGKNNPLMHYPTGLRWLPNIYREDYRNNSMYSLFGQGSTGPCVQEMPKFGNVVVLFAMCYDKGSRIVGMIEERLGEAAFLDFMRIVYSRYSYRILRIADFQHELEDYTGQSWREFFEDWLYGTGLSDWAIGKVEIEKSSLDHSSVDREPWTVNRSEHVERESQTSEVLETSEVCERATGHGPRATVKVVVELTQHGEYLDQTTLGIAMPQGDGYSVRIPILPQAQSYQIDDPPASVQVVGAKTIRVEVWLPEKPKQIAVDPDQILVDREPDNNYWKKRGRLRFTPVYTFLEETDLTNGYDRWNLLFGPWIYGPPYEDIWYTRSTMIGLRAGAYRTQHASAGVYAAYRTDFRDLVFGADGLVYHWPDANMQIGWNLERRFEGFQDVDEHAFRAVVFNRYVITPGSSLYLAPTHFVEAFAKYSDNFMPQVRQRAPGGERFDYEATAGIHYRKDYLTPYWDAEGGYRLDFAYEAGVSALERQYGIHKASGQVSLVKSFPDLSPLGSNLSSGPVARWLQDTRFAFRLYGAVATPGRGEFFSLGGSQLLRGYDQAERQGSSLWVASAEWRVPVARDLKCDILDHTVGLRNVYTALFYDAGNAYIQGEAAGPVAHSLGTGLRLDVAWFSFIERTTIRLDLAKTVNDTTPVQVWFGVQHPF
jgi:hypothetical protein